MQNTEIKKTVLDNGLTLVSEHSSAFRSIALGIWVKTGSRFETIEERVWPILLNICFLRGLEQDPRCK